MENNKLYKKDIIEFLKECPNETFDLVIADPPYNILKNDWDYYQNDRDYYAFMDEWINLCFTKIKKGGSIYIFNTPRNNARSLITAEKRGYKFRNWIVWNKQVNYSFPKKEYVNKHESILFFTRGNNSTFNYDSVRDKHLQKTNVTSKDDKVWDNFEFLNKNGELSSDIWNALPQGYLIKKDNIPYLHPSEKPVELIEKMIKASSNEGDLVLDLFSGSGTTSYAAKSLNRNFIAVEKDDKYCETIKNRLKL